MVADKLIINGSKYTVDTLDRLPAVLHPKAFAERVTQDSVMCYGRHSVFSNFYTTDFVLDGEKFSSVQQFYHFQKVSAAGNGDLAAKIFRSFDPVEQYRIGKGITPGIDKWDEASAEDNMEKAVGAKFVQNPVLLKALLDTKSKTLIECNPHDLVWTNGLKLTDQDAEDGTKWKGRNILGNILCRVRESLK